MQGDEHTKREGDEERDGAGDPGTAAAHRGIESKGARGVHRLRGLVLVGGVFVSPRTASLNQHPATLTRKPNTGPDWTPLASSGTPSAALAQAASLLETETFSKTFAHDALGRVTSATQPDLSELRPTYNDAGLLTAIDARIRGAAVWTAFVAAIAYDEKGRRTRIDYGNGTFTEYVYDPLSYRLTRIRTLRPADSATLQDLKYFYDPVGNITTVRDDAQQDVFFAGQQVTPTQDFVYDAIYRLVQATGREHAGGVGDSQRDQNDLPLWSLPHPNDAQALRQYTETYAYDGVGNLLEMFHDAGNGPGTWRRKYAYGAQPFGPGAPPIPANNRLHSTSLPGDAATGPFSATYTHDANGNMVVMPHLAEIAHTHADQMKRADLGGGGTAYYTYGADGERVRKVIQRLGTTREERIYLGGWGLYRKRQGASGELVLERETLHVMDGSRRIAMVETKTVDAAAPGTLTIVPRVRFQYSNHLDSAHLECDDGGLVISYEEYHPYGTPAYRSARSGVEVSEKRYRYTGKERDDETGFQYHSARYYAPWLARWTSADPGGVIDGLSLFAYVRNDPEALIDTTGRQGNNPNEDEFIGQTADGGFIRANGEVAYGPYDEQAAAAPAPSAPPQSSSTVLPEPPKFRQAVYEALTGVPAQAPGWRPTNELAADRLHAQGLHNLAWLAEQGFACSYCHLTKDHADLRDANDAIDLQHLKKVTALMGTSRVVLEAVIVVNQRRASTDVTIAKATEGSPGPLASESSLTKRQQQIHSQLAESGATGWFRKRDVSMSDLRAITRVTGDEYQVYTLGGRRFVMRAYRNELQVAPTLADEIRAGKYGRASGHTHPPGYSTAPSTYDREFLPSGQTRSAIWSDEATQPNVFHRIPTDDDAFRLKARQAEMRKLYEQ